VDKRSLQQSKQLSLANVPAFQTVVSDARRLLTERGWAAPDEFCEALQGLSRILLYQLGALFACSLPHQRCARVAATAAQLQGANAGNVSQWQNLKASVDVYLFARQWFLGKVSFWEKRVLVSFRGAVILSCCDLSTTPRLRPFRTLRKRCALSKWC
jgi:hypothetical protein